LLLQQLDRLDPVACLETTKSLVSHQVHQHLTQTWLVIHHEAIERNRGRGRAVTVHSCAHHLLRCALPLGLSLLIPYSEYRHDARF
jgi:hypothetical protein